MKIFSVYFDRRPLWKSDCIEPIQAGKARTGEDLGMLADDSGDSISSENARYGEMTAWYWVWKNWLEDHPGTDYIGFCHYRRFLDYTGTARRNTVRMTYRRFRRLFERRYHETELLRAIGGADLAMRKVEDSGFPTIRDQIVHWHPELAEDFDRFVSLIRERDPGAGKEIDAVLGSGRLAMELQFVMRAELFRDFMDWTFSLCREFERRWGWSGDKDGERARTPAFLVERLFLVWLAVRRTKGPVEVREFPLIKLNGRPWWYRLAKPVIWLLPEAKQEAFYNRYK